jgi:hypothetical protein
MIRTCTLRSLPPHQALDAARVARSINPANAPLGVDEPGRAALLTQKYWGAAGVDLTVSFVEAVSAALRGRILSHANAWGESADVQFRWTQQGGQVRVSLAGRSYWSYLGVDVLSIPPSEPTMALGGFTSRTPESEFVRVVRHEFGHTLGLVHEHLRRELVARLDRARVIAWGARTQGWSEAVSVAQMLTPVEESALLEPTRTDGDSVMCYAFGGDLAVDGRPITGGTDIDALDRAYVAKLYPKGGVVTPPPGGTFRVALEIDPATRTAKVIA